MTQYEREDQREGDAAPGERTPAQIEQEIERTRERMSSNIDALGERLSPDNLKRQAKDAIAEKAQDVVANVGDQARETGSRVIDFLVENPLPVAAVSLGAVWLFTLRKGGRSEVSGDRMARFAYTGPERRQPDGRPGLGRRLLDRAESVRHAVSDAASHAGERVGELKERAQERAGGLRSTARTRARKAKGRLQRVMDENPLALAAGAAILGIALGMILPETEPERRVMGEARDELGDRVSNVASRVKEVAVEAGRDLQDTVREEVDQRSPEITSTLKDAASNVKDQVKDAVGRATAEVKKEIRRPSSGSKG